MCVPKMEKSALAPLPKCPTSVRRSGCAQHFVADQRACSGEKYMSRTATAITKGMLVVYELPGLQSEAKATLTPASKSLRASG